VKLHAGYDGPRRPGGRDDRRRGPVGLLMRAPVDDATHPQGLTVEDYIAHRRVVTRDDE
jgi:hypothetical protein